jgi:hypothetical protein
MRSSFALRPFRAALALLVLAGAHAYATPVARLANVDEFVPSQMERGDAAIAGYHVAKWQKDAAQRGMSFRQYAREVLRPKFAGTQINEVIKPDGSRQNTDAHHRMSALRKVTKLTGVSFGVGERQLFDYTGWTEEAYAEHFINVLKKGQFTEEVEKLPPVERMRMLPATYDEMRDNPLRSTMEFTFGAHGIDGGWMRDYVEFRIVRKMLKEGLLDELKAAGVVARNARELPARLAADPRVIAAVARRLPGMKEYLLSEANDDVARQTLAERLDAMR